MISDYDLQQAYQNLHKLDPDQKARVLGLMDERNRMARLDAARTKFIPFVKEMWPGVIIGAHHEIMGEAFERVADGTLKRLILNLGPRHTKSEMASWLLPAWFLGRYPKKKIIQASATENLASGFGRKVRNLVGMENMDDMDAGELTYADIFPGITLSKDSKAASGWHTNKGGEYFAIGTGGVVTGKGGDLIILDDIVSEQEAKQAESNPDIYDASYEWFRSGPRQRLQPGGAMVIVQCMTGDTDVLMADGRTTKLRDIRPADEVATYENGEVATSRVVNWQSNGVDAVYTVQTQSGIIVRANERHPFLVNNAGVQEWVRLRDLKPGMSFVTTKGATDRQDLKPDQVCAKRASLETATTEKTPAHPTSQSGIMDAGKAFCASIAMPLRSLRAACALRATGNSTPHRNTAQKYSAPERSKAGTELRKRNTTSYSPLKAGNAQFVENPHPRKTRARTGAVNFASIMTTIRGWFAGYFATTATSPSGTAKPPMSCVAPLTTYSITTDLIVSITPDGYEEVFDVEIERTENFFANGVVSHNTRWSKKDLTGRLISAMQARGEKESGDRWEVIELPAILDEGLPTERAMWPGFWSLEELQNTRTEIGPAKFRAQYQQQPTSEEGAIIKKEAWRVWGSDKETCPGDFNLSAWNNYEPPACSYIILSIDTALKKNQRADYSAFTVWGVFDAENPDTGRRMNNLILLNAFKERLEFPALKRRVKDTYNSDLPDTILIEDKGSGISLIQELRSMGVPVEAYSYGRGSKAAPNDKVARANMVADIFASGYVWRPDRRYAEEVAIECADFPNGDHDDYLDSTVQAMIRFRAGGFIQTANDIDDDEDDATGYVRKRYY